MTHRAKACRTFEVQAGACPFGVRKGLPEGLLRMPGEDHAPRVGGGAPYAGDVPAASEGGFADGGT